MYIVNAGKKGSRTKIVEKEDKDAKICLPIDKVEADIFFRTSKDHSLAKRVRIDVIKCAKGMAVYFDDIRVSGRDRRADGGPIILTLHSSLGNLAHQFRKCQW